MPDPTYWTAAGFKTLEEIQSSIEHCVALVRYAKAVEDAATEVLIAAAKLRGLRDDLQVEILKTKLLPLS